jgi:hypothetical protein
MNAEAIFNFLKKKSVGSKKTKTKHFLTPFASVCQFVWPRISTIPAIGANLDTI